MTADFEELTHESRNAHEIMQKFYDYLLAGDLYHETRGENKRLSKSFCSDVMFAL